MVHKCLKVFKYLHLSLYPFSPRIYIIVYLFSEAIGNYWSESTGLRGKFKVKIIGDVLEIVSNYV